MSRARILDESDIPRRVDVLVVGSGPVGATYARIIAERAPRASILMVEAGPRLTDIPGVHVRNISDEAERAEAVRLSEGPSRGSGADRLIAHFDATVDVPSPAPGTAFLNPTAFVADLPMAAAAMSRNVGGQGSHWATACPTPRRLERASFIPDPEWERILGVGRKLLAVSDRPTTDSAPWHECLERIGREFDPDRAADAAVRNMPVAAQTQSDGSVYWTGPDVILDDLARRERETFAILPDTLVRELVADEKRVGGAILEHRPSGALHRIDATVVVVAADSLHTPQLLWASGIRPRALGRYLNDHTMVGALITPDYLDPPDRPADLYAETRTLNNVTGAPSSGMGWIPLNDDALPIHGQFGQRVMQPNGTSRPVGLVMFGFMLAKEARIDDRVWFSDEAQDPYGMPQVFFDYGYSEGDRKIQAFARQELERVASALGASDLDVTMQTDGMSLHYLGTTRMGIENDGESVCDDYLRVWGFENLYVGGNGVISTPLACNPTLTSVSLAVRAAEHAARLVG